jgi:hypothetical protein
MSKVLISLSAEKVRWAYMRLGVDVNRFLHGINCFQLVEQEHGLRRWLPAVSGDGEFYEQLSLHPWYYMKEKDEFSVARKIIGEVDVLEVGCGCGHFADGSEFSSYVGLELNACAAR